MMSSSPVNYRYGSNTALSLLAACPEAQLIAGAVVGGVAITVAGAVFIYKEIKEYQEKKHLAEIKAVNNLWEKHLSKIFVPGKSETLTLPIIFKMKNDKDVKSVESIHYNDEIIWSIADKLPAGTDIALSKYQHTIRNAILKLKEYYFSKSNHHDITACVISYLLEMLDTHCLKFEGYDYDIAYLGALASFINEYASLDRRVNTKKFSHLDEVYSHIVSAQHMLDIHKDKLSLTEIITDLNNSCRNLNDKYLRTFAMMINPNDTWKYTKTVTLKELSQGMLKKYFVENDFLLGLITIPDNEVDILDSPFKECLMQLADYAGKSLDSDLTFTLDDIPKINITVPDLKRYNELKAKKTQTKEKMPDEEKAEKKRIKNQFEELKNVFYQCVNFMTTELDPKTKRSRHTFIAVTSYDEIVKRVELIRRYADFIFAIISLQYYSMVLIKGIKLLGEIDITSEHHRKVFTVMDELFDKIKNDYLKIREEFYNIQDNNNAMQLVWKTDHRDKIYALLETTSTSIDKSRTTIKNYVNKNRLISKERIISAEHDLFFSADIMSKVLSLPCGKTLVNRKKIKPIPPTPPKKIIIQQPSKPVDSHPLGLPDTSPETDKNDIQLSQPVVDISDKIGKKLDIIESMINSIKKEEKPSASDLEGNKSFESEIHAYVEMQTNTRNVHQKIKELSNDKNKTAERTAKMTHLLNVLTVVTKKYADFIKLNRKERMLTVSDFNQGIQKLLLAQNRMVIDHHENDFWKVANSIFGEGYFRTDSRIRLSELSTACANMARLLVDEEKEPEHEHDMRQKF